MGKCKHLFVSWVWALLIGGGALAVSSAGAAPQGNLYAFDSGLHLGEARLFSPWWGTVQRNALQRVQLDVCLTHVESCTRRQRLLHTLVHKGRTLPVEDKLQLVNRFLNRKDYEIDNRWNSAPDPREEAPVSRTHWSTLQEFLERGGDCEDYAAAKYFLLRLLDLPAEQMRVVVAWERELRGYHAVLAYRWPDDRVWLLESDNVIKKRSHAGYRYVYALNEQGVWDYRPEPGSVRKTRRTRR